MKTSRTIAMIFFLFLPLVQLVSAGYFSAKFDEQRIVNGTDVPWGKYPAQVSLQQQLYHICSGSIVSRKFVLTAAHCCNSVTSVDTARVVTSTVDLRVKGRSYKLFKLIVHPKYNVSNLLINDVCLIKIHSQFHLEDGESIVNLPNRLQNIWSGSWGTALGWGLTMPAGQVSMVLKEVDQIIINYQECSGMIGQIYSSQACCYFPLYGKGICEGDSGGPVMWQGIQLGLMSWRDGSKPCAASPAVFVQLALYVDWIYKHIR